MQPAFGSLDRSGAFTVLAFFDGMIVAGVDDLLVAYDCAFHGIHQGPAYSAAASGIDESVLRARVESIFAVHELGVKHHVALLAACLDVRQTLPGAEVPGAGHPGCRHCG